MSDISLETARKTASVSLVHEMQKLIQLLVLHGPYPVELLGDNPREFEGKSNKERAWSHILPALSFNAGDIMLNNLLKDADFVESMKALVEAVHSSSSDWLSTEEAGTFLGFSRTYIIALLESEDFEGAVIRSKGGHRRISRRSLEAWKIKNGIEKPLDDESEEKLRGQLDIDVDIDELRASTGAKSSDEKDEKKFQQYRERSLAALRKN